jgi:tRNA A37 threonylcarbamoyladenosine synthetase subunit TsaC/SUA5/YrdC
VRYAFCYLIGVSHPSLFSHFLIPRLSPRSEAKIPACLWPGATLLVLQQAQAPQRLVSRSAKRQGVAHVEERLLSFPRKRESSFSLKSEILNMKFFSPPPAVRRPSREADKSPLLRLSHPSLFSHFLIPRLSPRSEAKIPACLWPGATLLVLQQAQAPASRFAQRSEVPFAGRRPASDRVQNGMGGPTYSSKTTPRFI